MQIDGFVLFKMVALFIWNLVRCLCYKIRYGKRFRVHPLQRISPGCSVSLYDKGRLIIGRNISIESGSDIQVHGYGSLSIGTGTYMNRYCMISVQESVSIGKGCMFGPGVKIFDNNHCFTKREGVLPALKSEKISIGDRCWIASNVIILKGAEIGDRCVIGAGCVISGKIPPESVVRLKQELNVTAMNAEL